MQILQALWKLIRMYLNYRKAAQAMRTGKGLGEMRDSMIKAYMEGDYETASMKAVDPFFKGCMLMELGKAGLAMPLLKHAADTATDPRSGALAHQVLGQLFMEDRQYDKAMEIFRTAQILWQERGGAERRMAELWLRRGGNSAEALRLARRSLEKERAFPGLSADSKKTSLCEVLSTLAWAVAVESHDPAEVDRLAAEAVALTGANPVSSTARMHLHLGHAYAAVGEVQKSSRHYDEAALIDPNGLSGRAAAAMGVVAGA